MVALLEVGGFMQIFFLYHGNKMSLFLVICEKPTS